MKEESSNILLGNHSESHIGSLKRAKNRGSLQSFFFLCAELFDFDNALICCAISYSHLFHIAGYS